MVNVGNGVARRGCMGTAIWTGTSAVPQMCHAQAAQNSRPRSWLWIMLQTTAKPKTSRQAAATILRPFMVMGAVRAESRKVKTVPETSHNVTGLECSHNWEKCRAADTFRSLGMDVAEEHR